MVVESDAELEDETSVVWDKAVSEDDAVADEAAVVRGAVPDRADVEETPVPTRLLNEVSSLVVTPVDSGMDVEMVEPASALLEDVAVTEVSVLPADDEVALSVETAADDPLDTAEELADVVAVKLALSVVEALELALPVAALALSVEVFVAEALEVVDCATSVTEAEEVTDVAEAVTDEVAEAESVAD